MTSIKKDKLEGRFGMLKKWLTGDIQTAKRDSFVWNAVAAAFNAGQSAIVLFFVAHGFGLDLAGIVTIGYAIANLFQTIGRYGLRNYQVTDVDEKFSFSDYFFSRVTTVGLALAASGIYLIFCRNVMGYSLEKTIIIFELVVLKLADAFAEVYIARYQQMGRLDIGSKIHAMELILSTIAMCVCLWIGMNLYGAILVGIVLTVIVTFLCIQMTKALVDARVRKWNSGKVFRLLKVGISLCVGLTLYMYIGNAPKYLIDIYMDEKSQAIFGYVMMPMFVITLLNNFLLQPILKDLGDVWGKKDLTRFQKMVLRQYLVICGLSVFVLIAGILIGLPVLSVFYGVDLNGYRVEFSILMAGATFYTVAYYLSVVLTTIRRQNQIVLGYIAAAILYICLGGVFLHTWGMLGAAFLYLISNALTAVLFTIFVLRGVKEEKKRRWPF